MSVFVYHFSSTLALPWVIADGALRPSSFGGPCDNYVWATSDPEGERTAAAFHISDELFESGSVRLVRFTLKAADFISWDEIKKSPLWAGADAEMLKIRERCARDGCGEHEPAKWHLRRELLPFTSVVRVDVALYGGRFLRIKATRRQCTDVAYDPPTKIININGFEFASSRMQNDEGDYYYKAPDREEVAEMWDALQEQEA